MIPCKESRARKQRPGHIGKQGRKIMSEPWSSIEKSKRIIKTTRGGGLEKSATKDLKEPTWLEIPDLKELGDSDGRAFNKSSRPRPPATPAHSHWGLAVQVRSVPPLERHRGDDAKVVEALDCKSGLTGFKF